jgi:ubiquinone/menaquinone biosynthesis C-methylase UbiE
MADDHRSDLRTHWDGRVERERTRENEEIDKKVHTDLLWREIKRAIGGRGGSKILDAGAGIGRFSIPLAEAGHEVIHLDISPRMVDSARQLGESRGVKNIKFICGSVENLASFDDDTFDLVLCLDSPLSFCYDKYKMALCALVRVAKADLILSVMGRSAVVSEGINFDLKHFGKLKTLPEVYSTGTFLVTEDLKKLEPDLMPSWHAFGADEIEELLSENGCEVGSISSPGALARFVQPDLLRKLYRDRESYESYLDFEQRYDSDPHILGAGLRGLLITATKLISA